MRRITCAQGLLFLQLAARVINKASPRASCCLRRYEPWGIVHRQHTPWFDARFRGYGRNKIMYAAALNSSGFSFVVDPDTFVVHRPHGISGAQTVFYEAPDRR